ncbi:hypothetical protein [Paraburkholderia phenoliruptrix]
MNTITHKSDVGGVAELFKGTTMRLLSADAPLPRDDAPGMIRPE